MIQRYLVVGNGFELCGTELGFVFWLWSWTLGSLDGIDITFTVVSVPSMRWIHVSRGFGDAR